MPAEVSVAEMDDVRGTKDRPRRKLPWVFCASIVLIAQFVAFVYLPMNDKPCEFGEIERTVMGELYDNARHA